jgi:hypothetical protein
MNFKTFFIYQNEMLTFIFGMVIQKNTEKQTLNKRYRKVFIMFWLSLSKMDCFIEGLG